MDNSKEGDSKSASLHDSVVGRDLHTGNVIHNHYHQAPSSPQPSVRVPQPRVIQQPTQIIVQQLPPQVVIKQPYDGSKRFSLTVAYFWCIFLGIIGAHRFYLKQDFTGIVYLLTAGLLCVGWVYDLIYLPQIVRKANMKHLPF